MVPPGATIFARMHSILDAHQRNLPYVDNCSRTCLVADAVDHDDVDELVDETIPPPFDMGTGYGHRGRQGTGEVRARGQ